MVSKDIIVGLVNEGFIDRGFFIVDVSISTDSRIEVLVDKEKGITISECVEITRFLRTKLGEEIDNYEVLVSSPGLDRPFKVIEQYRKNEGKIVEVIKKDGIKITGKLNVISDEYIEIEEEIKAKSKKNEEAKSVKIEFSNIKSTKEVIKIN
jgi:ribosome maturation factor RimP